ncbi:MAG: DUF3043 domain-containing protein [Kineosporiaceae bacterium]
MFGRGKNQTTPADPLVDEPALKTAGKGRPTPSRREAEQRRRTPLVATSNLPANATKAERKAAEKAARNARREAMAKERNLQRQALLTGDEAHLPARDRGPARRWVRDYVDARRNIGELFLPMALIVLALSLVKVPTVQLAAMALLYGAMVAVIIDSVLLRRRLKRETEQRFGDKATGAPGYGMMRALQYRRFRMPRPQVARGQFPK